jgi:uncharacterized repeat protein (TIGR03803 family)
VKATFRTTAFVALAMIVVTCAGAATKEKVLYRFAGGADGTGPDAGLTSDKTGNFYGTTLAGGNNNSLCFSTGCGTVFKLTHTATGWKHRVLYRFCADSGCTDGQFASKNGVIFDKAGNLYGVTSWGGTRSQSGVAYELSPSKSGWTETVIHTFDTVDNTDGQSPIGNLVFDKAGNLYGVTQFGGAMGGTTGTVFALAGGKETILYTFTGKADGAYPSAGSLALDGKGNLFGTTKADGQWGFGTVFRLGSSGLTTLYSFTSVTGGTTSPVVLDAAGNLYGTTDGLNNYGEGTVFKLSHSASGWNFHILLAFNLTKNGAYPSGVVFHQGDLWGVTDGYDFSCNLGCGTVYKLSPANGHWTHTVVYHFKSTNDGRYPSGPLIFDGQGNVYGTTYKDSSQQGAGTVFEITP